MCDLNPPSMPAAAVSPSADVTRMRHLLLLSHDAMTGLAELFDLVRATDDCMEGDPRIITLRAALVAINESNLIPIAQKHLH